MILQTLNRHEQDIPSVSHEDSLVVYRDRIHSVKSKIVAPYESIEDALSNTLSREQKKWVLGEYSVRKLEKRFVLRGNLAVKDEPLMHNLTDCQILAVGTFLLEAMNKEFKEVKDLNSLNSAVRLTDYLLSFPLEHIKHSAPLKTALENLLNNLETLNNE